MENKTIVESQELINYVVSQIHLGLAQDEIKKQLYAVGWSDEEVDGAYAVALTKCGVPVPARNVQEVFSKKSTTVEIVINFFSFILLGIFTTSLGMLLYGIINYFFQDNLNNNYYSASSSSETIHYAIASLIISFPLYYLAMRFWFRRFREDEGKIESRLTKWITYLVLLITAITIVVDLIVVIFSMLQGEITVRFFLKALTIFMIAGGVFGFYFLERKKVQYKKDIDRKVFVIFGWAVIGVVGLSIILGFVASGSPQTQRMRGFDNTRSSDLESLASCMDNYASEHKSLPESLNVLAKDSSYSYCSNKKDPETGDSYSYRITNKSIKNGDITEGEFELCANFSLESKENDSNGYSSYNKSKWFIHSSGKNCNTENAVLDNGDNADIKK